MGRKGHTDGERKETERVHRQGDTEMEKEREMETERQKEAETEREAESGHCSRRDCKCVHFSWFCCHFFQFSLEKFLETGTEIHRKK